MICDFCDLEGAVETSTVERVPYKGSELLIEGYLSVRCPHCDEEFVTATQSRHNDRLVMQAKASHEGILTADEVRLIRERLEISQTDAARVFGGGPNAFYKYEHSEVLVSQAMNILLRMSDELPEAANWLLERAGLTKSNDESTWGNDSEVKVVQLAAFRSAQPHLATHNLDVSAANDWNDVPYEELQVARG